MAFRLDKLPRGPDSRDWIEYIQLDGTCNRCILPSTPREYLLNIHTNVCDLFPDHIWDIYDSVADRITMIEPETWTRTPCSRPVLNDLSYFAFKSVVEESYGIFSTLQKYGPQSHYFQWAARVLLTAAAPGLLHVTESLAEDESKDYRFSGRKVTTAQHSSWRYRTEGHFYWFRNCLIVFASWLEEWLEGWIGMTVERIQQKHSGRSTCTALLWSVRHVVAIVVSDSGISRSPLIPVIEAFGVDDDAFVNAVDFLMHFLQPSHISIAPGSQSSPNASYACSAANTGIRLPFDVVMRILDYADVKTYNSCATLSKIYRINWSRHPRVGRSKLFKARHATNDGGNPPEHAVGALPFGDSIMSSPCSMRFFHADFELWSRQPEEPGTQLFFHIPSSDVVCCRLEFVPLNLTESNESLYYIVPEEVVDQCSEKKAFKHPFNTIAYRRSNYGINYSYRG